MRVGKKTQKCIFVNLPKAVATFMGPFKLTKSVKQISPKLIDALY